MEAVITAAIVAAIVSALGLLVNLKIARDTRQGNLLQIRFQSALKGKEEAVKEIKLYVETVERFRSACWGVSAQLILLKHRKTDLDEIESQTRKRMFDLFEKEADEFFKSWAKIKAETAQYSESTVEYARAIRHACKNQADDIIYFMLDKKKQIDKGFLKDSDRNIFEVKIERLLRDLDELFNVINDMRNRIITDIILN